MNAEDLLKMELERNALLSEDYEDRIAWRDRYIQRLQNEIRVLTLLLFLALLWGFYGQ